MKYVRRFAWRLGPATIRADWLSFTVDLHRPPYSRVDVALRPFLRLSVGSFHVAPSFGCTIVAWRGRTVLRIPRRWWYLRRQLGRPA